jgi:Domain of unknown function (DUF222)/HNH endonuclease
MSELLVSPSIDSPARVDELDEPQLDILEARICELAGHLAAATYQFLVLVGDFDTRRGWASWELPSCSAWLAWKCQIAPGTAREQVRVARALRELPVIGAEFAAGRMSYAKVRALTRIATPDTEAGLAELAGPMTAAQLERFVAAHRTVTQADDERARRMRRLSFRVEADGQLTMTIRLPAADGAVVLQALRAATGDIARGDSDVAPAETLRSEVADGDPAARPDRVTSPKHTADCLADALVEVASAYLGGVIATASDPDIYQVVVHVGTDALSCATPVGVSAETQATAAGERAAGHPADPSRCHLQDGPAISPAAAQRIACSATFSWMLHDHTGDVLDVGRRHRRPPPALRRAVRERDCYRCQYPGCNSWHTDIHHIVPWARGGATELSNLSSLCQAHHVIVHELGLAVSRAPDGTLNVDMPDGTPVPASPQLPGGRPDLRCWHDADITSETITPYPHDKLDLHLAIWACFANARVAEERRQEQAARQDQQLAA